MEWKNSDEEMVKGELLSKLASPDGTVMILRNYQTKKMMLGLHRGNEPYGEPEVVIEVSDEMRQRIVELLADGKERGE